MISETETQERMRCSVSVRAFARTVFRTPGYELEERMPNIIFLQGLSVRERPAIPDTARTAQQQRLQKKNEKRTSSAASAEPEDVNMVLKRWLEKD